MYRSDMSEWGNKCLNEGMNAWRNRWVAVWLNEWITWLNECLKELMHEWIITWVTVRMIAWINARIWQTDQPTDIPEALNLEIHLGIWYVNPYRLRNFLSIVFCPVSRPILGFLVRLLIARTLLVLSTPPSSTSTATILKPSSLSPRSPQITGNRGTNFARGEGREA